MIGVSLTMFGFTLEGMSKFTHFGSWSRNAYLLGTRRWQVCWWSHWSWWFRWDEGRKKAEAGSRLVGRGKDVNNLGGMNDYQARQAGINSTHLCKLFPKVTYCNQNTDSVLTKKLNQHLRTKASWQCQEKESCRIYSVDPRDWHSSKKKGAINNETNEVRRKKWSRTLTSCNF